jgi:hypothetical protein
MSSSYDNFSWLFAQIAKPVKRRPQPFSRFDRAVKLLNTTRPRNADYRWFMAAVMAAQRFSPWF